MLKRRSFLGAMLASFTAPYVMADAVKRGTIMVPAPPKIILPGDGGILMPANFTGPMIKLFTAAGILLAEIPLNERQQALFDYGRSVAMDFSGQGDAVASGMATDFELALSKDRRIKGKVGNELRLNNAALVTGQCIEFPALGIIDHKHVMDPRWPRTELFDREIIKRESGYSYDDEGEDV